MEDASSKRQTPMIQSISRRFSYAFIGVVTLLLFGFATVAIFINITETEKELERRLTYSLKLSTTTLPKALWNLDNDVVNDFIESLFLDDDIVHAKVLWADQVIVERTRKTFQGIGFSDPAQSSRFMFGTSDITFKTDKVGAIQIVMSRESIKNELIFSISSIIALTLLIIIGISLTSVAITRRYISSPLSKLQSSAALLARGDVEALIEITSNDEIGVLANDLNTMRLSIKKLLGELRESNERLKQYGHTLEQKVEERTAELGQAMSGVEEARQRLIEAIESISEGFSLYDPEDRLIICNSRYYEQLYPGMSDEMKPGTSFETVIRTAVERGLVEEVNDFESVDAWIENRLERHRNPTGSFIQRRGQRQWFQISERRTEDGGYVAVYTDITEIKDREEELAEKSKALEQLSNQLAKYLSPQVYDSIFSGKQEVKVASSRKKLTVFFSDIVEFTETADRLESEELTRLLNHYLTEMSRIALEHGATIDKYIGDAIMIFFGDPESKGVKEDAIACVEMALAMRRRLSELTDVWREEGIEKPIKCRMGIHTGFCTVGNFGSEDRLDYTIIGSAVNTASRLEALATPGEILISYETFAHVKELVRCEEHGQAEVKGIAYPVATYRVVDTFEAFDRQQRYFHAEHPAVKVELDLDAMTTDDRKQALETLRKAHALLSESNISGGAVLPIELGQKRKKSIGS